MVIARSNPRSRHSKNVRCLGTMRENSLKAQCKLILACTIFCLVTSVGVQGTRIYAQKPPLTYDLLFLSSTPQNWMEVDRETVDLTLNYLNTENWEIARIATDDKPVALSPDGRHLAVFRNDQLCLVNSHWQTEFCLPAGLIDRVGSDDVTSYFMNTALHDNRIYWDSDSNGLWAVEDYGSSTTPTILQIAVSDGSVIREIALTKDYTHIEDSSLYLIDFSPITMTAVLGTDASSYICNVETGDISYSLLNGSRWTLSPDGQKLANARHVPDDDILGVVTDLSGAPVIYIGPEVIQRKIPGMTWVKARTYDGLMWSHDGNKLAFRHPVFLDGLASTTAVYFLDTQQVLALSTDRMEGGELIWSPNDAAIAQVISVSIYAGNDLSIVSLDGSVTSVVSDLSDNLDQQRKIYSVIWLPHGWLQAG
jgi:hypothetical protein